MSQTPVILIAAQDVPAALPGTPPFTSPTVGKGTWIDHVTLTNHTAAVSTVAVSVVPLAGTVGVTNTFNYSIAAGATALCPELVGKFMAPGDFIQWAAATATTIAGAMNGRNLA